MMYDLESYFYLDDDYVNKANFCNESGEYSIEEIEPDEKGRRFKFVKIEKAPIDYELQSLTTELSDLKFWFNDFFDKQLIQSLWQTDYTVSHDNYFNKDYETVEDLKEQAEVVRARIKELKSILNLT